MTISKFNAEGYYDPTPYKALKKKYMPLVYIASPSLVMLKSMLKELRDIVGLLLIKALYP